MPFPSLTGFSSAADFAENAVNAAPQRLDPNVTFAWGSVVGGTLTVRGLLAEDRVSIENQGSGAGQIGFDGASVTYGNTTIGTASGGVGADFTVTLDADATSAAIEALIEHLTYANVSDNPSATRNLTLDLVDTDGQRASETVTQVFVALTGIGNPFNGFDVGGYSAPSFVDWDGDGDLDLVSGERYGTLLAWRNTGSATEPAFTAVTGIANPFNGIDVGYASTPSFVDWDGDGDLDLIAGEQHGTLLAWRNTGSAMAPEFAAVTGSENPFDGFDVDYLSTPSFVDWDGDGDLDLVSGANSGTLLAWRNISSATTPVLTAVADSDNPFNGIGAGLRSTPSFVDWDGDGDFDLVSGQQLYGTLLAWHNTGSATAPVFTAATGSDNPFNGFDVPLHSTPSFVDWDGDGDLDLVVGGNMAPCWLGATRRPLARARS
jgi:hypothetical protein